MEQQYLEIFVDVMRHGSFAAAARHREIDPSSVSRAISGLERELRARLFQRTTRQLTPTDAAQEYFTRIEPLVAELRAAGDDIARNGGTPQGRVRLTASVAFGQACLVPLLSELTEQYPDLDVGLVLTDLNLDIVADRIDLAIRLGSRNSEAIGQDMIGVRLFDTGGKVCASPGYLTLHGWPVEPASLATHDCLLPDLPSYRDKWQFRLDNSIIDTIDVEGRMTISNPLATRDACLVGLGPALLPNWLIRDELKAGQLIDLYPGLDVSAGNFDTAAWLLYPNRQYLPQKTRAMIDFLKAKLPLTV
jgi:DNA-binding transcriptional LysR family regulator